MEEEKDQFYHIVWNSFIADASQPKTSYTLNKESYKQYKNQLL
jgi:hypothetical protein